MPSCQPAVSAQAGGSGSRSGAGGAADGPSCTDDNQLVFGIPIPLMALVAFTVIGALSALSLKEPQE